MNALNAFSLQFVSVPGANLIIDMLCNCILSIIIFKSTCIICTGCGLSTINKHYDDEVSWDSV